MKYTIVLTILLLGLLAKPSFTASSDVKDIEAVFLSTLKEQVLIKNSTQAMGNLEQLSQSLQRLKKTGDQSALNQAQDAFKALVRSWKSVEAVYVAGFLNEDYLDHPRFIDYFHQAKESIPAQVQKALDSEAPLKSALFKYSTKSINALEYLLFSPPAKGTLLQDMQRREQRRINAALMAVDSVSSWLSEITQFYQSDTKLHKNPAHAIGVVVNALIDSSYKLANWRVGEAAGLTKKYMGKPSAKRLEYPLSSSSRLAIEAILKTHRAIIDSPGEKDLLAVAGARNAATEMIFVRDKIDTALKSLTQLPPSLSQQVKSSEFAEFYKQLNAVHNAYYFMLIDALGLNAKIMDADGD